MSIATECMVVNLHQGMWEGRKLDKEAGRNVTTQAGAASDAATVNKMTVPKEALFPIQQAKGALYNHYLQHTLPWKDNGDRLLSRKMYMKFIEEHEELVAKFKETVTHFLDNVYPGVVAQAQFRMAGLFKASDYPPAEVLRQKFYAKMVIDAVSEPGDFRVKMSVEATEAIQARMEADINERVGKVMAGVWQKLYAALEHYCERMSNTEKGARLYESTKDNLIELCDLLPGLNILNDPDLKQLGRDIKARLEGFDIKDMKHPKRGPALKSAAAKEAEDIMETMKGFMTAFGVNADTDE